MKAKRISLAVLAVAAVMLAAASNVHAQSRVPQVRGTWAKIWSSGCNDRWDRCRDRYYDDRCFDHGYRGDSFVSHRHVNVEVPIGPIVDLIRGLREPVFVTAMDPSPAVRVVVVERQAPQPSRSDNEELVARIQRQKELQRQAEERARQELFEKLLKQLKNPYESERREAVSRLAEFPPSPRAREALARVLGDDPNTEVRLEVVKAFAKLKDEETIPALKKALADPDKMICQEVRRAIEDIEMEAIFRGLDSERKKDREEAVEKLAAIPNQELARDVLGKVLLQDLEPSVREQAAEGLLKIGDQSSLPDLTTAGKQDPNEAVRDKVKKAVARIEEEAQKAAGKPAARLANPSKR